MQEAEGITYLTFEVHSSPIRLSVNFHLLESQTLAHSILRQYLEGRHVTPRSSGTQRHLSLPKRSRFNFLPLSLSAKSQEIFQI